MQQVPRPYGVDAICNLPHNSSVIRLPIACMRILAAMLLVAGALATATAQVRLSSIQGVVVKSDSTDELAETPVELTSASGGPARYTTITDSTGQFRFTDIPAGDYRLAAMRTGYLRSEYGQRSPGGRGLVLTLTAGQQLQNVRVELTETGAISGRIFNGNGLPFPNVQVQALKYGYEDGRRVLKTVRAILTDDLGQSVPASIRRPFRESSPASRCLSNREWCLCDRFFPATTGWVSPGVALRRVIRSRCDWTAWIYGILCISMGGQPARSKS
jgi:hypothetical protein